ncbi:MAG: hypothetical protein ACI8T1_002779 [Verrucomicrobiales bacterium]|jgi:hypothetical protein
MIHDYGKYANDDIVRFYSLFNLDFMGSWQ